MLTQKYERSCFEFYLDIGRNREEIFKTRRDIRIFETINEHFSKFDIDDLKFVVIFVYEFSKWLINTFPKFNYDDLKFITIFVYEISKWSISTFPNSILTI